MWRLNSLTFSTQWYLPYSFAKGVLQIFYWMSRHMGLCLSLCLEEIITNTSFAVDLKDHLKNSQKPDVCPSPTQKNDSSAFECINKEYKSILSRCEQVRHSVILSIPCHRKTHQIHFPHLPSPAADAATSHRIRQRAAEANCVVQHATDVSCGITHVIMLSSLLALFYCVNDVTATK